jgi:acetolactate synthase-1/3 small subunit
MALYKVSTKIVDNKRRFDYILNSSNGRVIEINSQFLILEKSGSRTELEKLRDKLDSMNMLTGFSRSGNVVLHRESIENLMQKVS